MEQKHYRVTFSIDEYAESPQEAAEIAWLRIKDSDNCWVWEVEEWKPDYSGKKWIVDMETPEQPEIREV